MVFKLYYSCYTMESYRTDSAEQGRNVLLALLHTPVILLLKAPFVPQ